MNNTESKFIVEVQKGVSKNGNEFTYLAISTMATGSPILITKAFLKDSEISLLKVLKIIND